MTALPPSDAPPEQSPAARMDAQIYYGHQETVVPPPELARLVPATLAHKPVRREEGRGMHRMRAAPGLRWLHLTLLTLTDSGPALAALDASIRAAGYTPTGRLRYADAAGSALEVSSAVERGVPVRLDLHLVMGSSEPPADVPTESVGVQAGGVPGGVPTESAGRQAGGVPTTWPADLAAEARPPSPTLRLVGFESGQFHALVPGGDASDVGRWALLHAAPDAAAATAAVTAWVAAFTRAGFAPRTDAPEVLERAASRDTVVVRAEPGPPARVLVSLQRRWTRPDPAPTPAVTSRP